jgi:thiol-disulfide isomerase/thioredoxin
LSGRLECGAAGSVVAEVTGFVVLVVTLLVAGGVGLLMRGRSGRMRPSSAVAGPGEGSLAADLATAGVALGDRATLLQFSSTFCAPCRATRAVLTDAAAAVPGVRHVDLDVADDAVLELVRSLGILRTPTTLVLDDAGREIRRASGVPRREQVLAALSATVG